MTNSEGERGERREIIFFKGEKHERQNIRTGTTMAMAQSKEVLDKRKKKKTLKDAIYRKIFHFPIMPCLFLCCTDGLAPITKNTPPFAQVGHMRYESINCVGFHATVFH